MYYTKALFGNRRYRHGFGFGQKTAVCQKTKKKKNKIKKIEKILITKKT